VGAGGASAAATAAAVLRAALSPVPPMSPMSRIGAGAGVPPVAARDLVGDDDARRVLNDAWIPDSGDTAGGATRASSRLAASGAFYTGPHTTAFAW